MNVPIFFDGSLDLLRAGVSAILLYAAIILLVRLTGKRSVAQLNNFDWIVIVVLGSLAATTILNNDVTLAESLVAMAALLFLQWGLTKVICVIPVTARLVKAEPRILFENGDYCADAMRRERVTPAEIRAAIRQKGLSSLSQVSCIVLETDARISVITEEAARGTDQSALADITRL